MLIPLIIAFPLFAILGMTRSKVAPKSLHGFFGILLTLVPMVYVFINGSVATLTIPSVYTLYWYFHSYSFVGAVSFVVVGSILTLFITQFLNRSQLIAFAIALSSALGITLSQNYFGLFVFWELLTISTSLIIFFEKDTDLSIGRNFLLTHLAGGLALLFGIMLQFHATQSLALVPPSSGQIFFLIGIGMKVGFVPLHFWIPATYSTIHPASTVALSIFTTKAGIVVLMKLFSGYEPLIYMGLLMIFFGIYSSLCKQNFREILSYQHVSQLGFMVVAIGTGGALGVNGGFMHMTNHMIYKSLLFMITALIFIYSGSESLKTQHKKPLWLLGFALLGSLAIMGLPPLNGFASKTLIKYASSDVIQILLSISAVGTALSFARFFYYGFWHTSPCQRVSDRFAQVGTEVKLAMGLLSGLILLIGVAPGILSSITPYRYESMYSLAGAIQALGAIAVGGLLFVVLRTNLQPVLVRQVSNGTFSNTLLVLANNLVDSVVRWEKHITQLNNAQFILPVLTLLFLLLMVTSALQGKF